MVDPIPMIKTLSQAMVVIFKPIVLMVVGIPGYTILLFLQALFSVLAVFVDFFPLIAGLKAKKHTIDVSPGKNGGKTVP